MDAGLSPSFFRDLLYFSSCVGAQTPAGRLLVSQMSGMHGKMQLVLSSQEASQASCAITQCADQQESRVHVMTRRQTCKDDHLLSFFPTFIADILICAGALAP